MAYFSIKLVVANLDIVTHPFRCGKAHGAMYLCIDSSLIEGSKAMLINKEILEMFIHFHKSPWKILQNIYPKNKYYML